MDPISIVSASAGLVVTCYKLTSAIYSFVDKTQTVDTAVRVLGIEIESLSHVLRSISTSFSDPSLAKAAVSTQTGHEAQHWENVERSMRDCKDTLERLQQVLENVNKGDSGFLWRPKKAIKLNMKAERIALLKQEIAAYRHTMQLSLQLITVYVSLAVPFCVVAYLTV
jgi:Fungal N-terminal domain of STAND proteins